MSRISDKTDVVRLENFPERSTEEVVSPVSEFENMPDLKLWQEFKKGSRAAFIFIYHKYFDKLYNYAYQFARDRDLVKDSIQDLFVELNYAKSRLSDTDSIQLYLYKSIKRKVLRIARRQLNSVDTDGAAWRNGFNIELSVEQKIINRQIADEQMLKLNDSVNKLTYRQREAIFYFYYEGFSLEQVNELLDMKSLKATQNLIYKAIKELRKLLAFIFLSLFFIH